MGASRLGARRDVEPEQAVNLEPGWYKDPFFLDHERYWDGKWTDQLRHIESGRPLIQTNAAADAVAAATVTAAAPRVPGGPGVATYPAAAGLDTTIGEPERADPSNESTSLIHDDDTLVVAFPAEPRPDDTATIPATRPADLDTGVLPAVSPVGASGDAPTDRKDDRPVAPRSAQWERHAPPRRKPQRATLVTGDAGSPTPSACSSSWSSRWCR